MRRPTYKESFTLACCTLAAFALPPAANAEFSLNFQPQGFARMSTAATHGASTIRNQTPFLVSGALQMPEVVQDPDTGDQYFHMIVGATEVDPNTNEIIPLDGFAQETYIRLGSGRFFNNSITGSSSLGEGNASGGNGRDPLDLSDTIQTGNSSANPRRVLLKQIIDDGEARMVYEKARYDRKALITQEIDSGDLVSSFSIDMTNSTFDDASTVGLVTNVMSIAGVGAGDFDMAVDAPDSIVNAGQYTYTNSSRADGAGGTYSYADGGFDHVNQDWAAFFNENVPNPWSYQLIEGGAPNPNRP